MTYIVWEYNRLDEALNLVTYQDGTQINLFKTTVQLKDSELTKHPSLVRGGKTFTEKDERLFSDLKKLGIDKPLILNVIAFHNFSSDFTWIDDDSENIHLLHIKPFPTLVFHKESQATCVAMGQAGLNVHTLLLPSCPSQPLEFVSDHCSNFTDISVLGTSDLNIMDLPKSDTKG